MAVYRATLSGDIYSQRCQNILHFHSEGANQEQALMVDLRDNWIPQVIFCQNANWSWRQIAVQHISSPQGPVLVTDIVPVQGTLTGDGAHPSLAIIFSLRTNTPGRTGRGRFYLPGCHEESIQNGVIHPNAVIVFSGAATALTNRYVQSGPSQFSLLVLPRSNPDNFKFVTNILARNRWGLQRRRNIGVGI